MKGENIAPILDGSSCLRVSNQMEFPLQVKPLPLNIQSMQKPELVVHHALGVISPHVVNSIWRQLGFAIMHVHVHRVHIRKQHASRLNVSFDQRDY